MAMSRPYPSDGLTLRYRRRSDHREDDKGQKGLSCGGKTLASLRLEPRGWHL
ncbi:hypothetical protein NHJ13734_005773 [Beauveria thailandica]